MPAACYILPLFEQFYHKVCKYELHLRLESLSLHFISGPCKLFLQNIPKAMPFLLIGTVSPSIQLPFALFLCC